jgi:hypothetical protein
VRPAQVVLASLREARLMLASLAPRQAWLAQSPQRGLAWVVVSRRQAAATLATVASERVR